MNYHKIKYENVSKKINMYTILNLDYKKIEPWIPRNYPKESIKEYYNLNYLYSKVVQLIPEPNTKNYNISKLKGYNIFFNLYLCVSRQVNINDNFILFTINTSTGYKICQISNKGSNLFNKNIIYSDNNYLYYHINLFECLEFKFICTNYYSDDIIINVHNNNRFDYYLFSEVSYINIPKISKFSEFYFFEKIIENPDIQSENSLELNIDSFCYSIYFHCKEGIEINNISVDIDNYKISEVSSKIVINNFENIYLIEFFPTNEYDFIKKNNIYGIFIDKIKINIDSNYPHINKNNICISIGTLNYRILKINSQ